MRKMDKPTTVTIDKSLELIFIKDPSRMMNGFSFTYLNFRYHVVTWPVVERARIVSIFSDIILNRLIFILGRQIF
jgi:hypothetical protein